MSKLFLTFVENGFTETWARALDWLFDDERFSTERGWTSGYVGAFTKKIKKLPMIGKNNYSYDAIKNLDFSNIDSNNIQIIHSKGDTEGRDFVRHIRNGIAHGRNEVRKFNGTDYIRILDYNRKNEQTAFIYVPLSYILDIYKAYKDVEKSKNNSNNKRRR